MVCGLFLCTTFTGRRGSRCPIYALMTKRGQLQSGDGSAGPRRVWEDPFQVEERPHHQKMNMRSALAPLNALPVVRPSCRTGAQFACISEQFQSSRHEEVS